MGGFWGAAAKGAGKAAKGGTFNQMFTAQRNKRAQNEASRLQNREDLFNYGRQAETRRGAQDLAGDLGTTVTGDYVTGGMLVPQSRDEIGGAALESLLNAAQGYNPVAAANPYMGVIGADRDMMQGLQQQAEAGTEATLSGWESAMGDLAAEYETAAAAQREERDRQQAAYEETIAADRDAEAEQIARQVVETWLASKDKKGALFGKVDSGAFGVRNKGANLGVKRDYVNDLLEQGYSYAEILSGNADVAEAIGADVNSSPLVGLYYDLAGGDASGAQADTAAHGGYFYARR